MKKWVRWLYYLVPFAVLPAFVQASDLLGDYLIREVALAIVYGILFLIPAAMGFFSPTKRAFDWVLLVLVPISMYWAIIIEGYFDRAYCMGRSIYNAKHIAEEPRMLLIYVGMGLIAFFASYRRFRFRNLRKPKS